MDEDVMNQAQADARTLAVAIRDIRALVGRAREGDPDLLGRVLDSIGHIVGLSAIHGACGRND